MPAVYEKMGIRFMYPDNWTLDEEEALHGNQSVSVYSPQERSGRSRCIRRRPILTSLPSRHSHVEG